MTAFERGVMRSIFPFYGWVGHIIRRVINYPLDHPLRAAIMSSVARAEIEDLNGLPERFLGMFIWGKPDKNGKQSAINVGAMNPFGDTADYFTMLGWATAMNPALTTVAEQLGVRDGQLEAYPDLRWDSESGRLQVSTPGVLGSFFTNTLPQSQIAGMLIGANKDFRDRMQTDPDAAMRSLLASGGIPMPYRRVSIPMEYARTELAAYEAQSRAKGEALRTGEDSRYARSFPQLQEYLAKLRALQESNPDALQPFTVTPDVVPPSLEAFNESTRALVTPTPSASAGRVPMAP